MAISAVRQIDQWEPGAVRRIATAAQARAAAMESAAVALEQLPAFSSWEGDVRDLAFQSVGVTRSTLDDCRNHAEQVASAADIAAGRIAELKRKLAELRQSAGALSLHIDPATNRVEPTDRTHRITPAETMAAIALQSQVAAMLAEANTIDGTLAAALDAKPDTSASHDRSATQGDTAPDVAGPDDRIIDEAGNGEDSSADLHVQMAGYGPAPLSPQSPSDGPLDAPSPAPTPSLTDVPAPLQDFAESQLRGQEVPGWRPLPPPVTGEPIRRDTTPQAPVVINMNQEPGTVDLFPNCDGGDVTKAFGQIAGGGIGGAIAATTGPLTGGVTWAGLGAAGLTIADGIDNLAACKGVS